MLSIGEFSKVTTLTVKTIRLYDETGLLPPASTNPETWYRYYDATCVERARVIRELRLLELPLDDIAQILATAKDEADLLSVLEKHAALIAEKLRTYQHIHRSLATLIAREKEATMIAQRHTFEIEEKVLATLQVAGIRGKGRYDDSGRRFSTLGRSLGRHTAGKPLNLFYDTEYKETDADFESCFPVKQAFSVSGVDAHELPGGRACTLVHRGPYESIGTSYRRLFEHIHAKGLKPRVPSREVYIKGPGMLFKGNPQKYLTELQVLVEG